MPLKSKLLIGCICCLLTTAASAQVRLVTTIKPLQLIAAAITLPAVQPELLLQAEVSPHQYALRPSERRLLEEADIVVWIGPALEGFLSGVMAELGVRVVTGLELSGVETHMLDARTDPHIWLNSRNADLIAEAVALQMTAADPGRARLYRDNLESFRQTLQELDLELEQSLGKQALAPYAVYHNAFRYFEDRYNLEHVVSFTNDEELKPGLRRVLDIRRELAASGVGCILVEPSLNTDELATMLDNPGLRYISVDVLGRGIDISQTAYTSLLKTIADAMLSCSG